MLFKNIYSNQNIDNNGLSLNINYDTGEVTYSTSRTTTEIYNQSQASESLVLDNTTTHKICNGANHTVTLTTGYTGELSEAIVNAYEVAILLNNTAEDKPVLKNTVINGGLNINKI